MNKMGVYQFYREQKLKVTLPEIWDFISSPANLKEITPPFMGFDIQSDHLPDKMYAGMMIQYKVKPLLNIPMTWLTEITQVREGEYFVDEQRVGPYALWHHQHILEEIPGGVLMKDLITYRLPLGFLGSLVNKPLVRKKLEQIFDYRRKVLEQKYATF